MKKDLAAACGMLLAGILPSQSTTPWLRSPVNGHYYARLPLSDFDSASSDAVWRGANLATIRNPAENSWLTSNALGGQPAWIGMGCDRSWTSGWPTDFVAGGSEPAICGTQTFRIFRTSTNRVGCSFNEGRCEGFFTGGTNSSCFISGRSYSGTLYYCDGSDFRFTLNSNGSWSAATKFGQRHALAEFITNTPYGWATGNSTNQPSARRGASVAHDEGRARAVFFGGFSGAELADTWEWGPRSGWIPRFTFVAPGARRDAAMVYDRNGVSTILFGGAAGSSAGNSLADTWSWNGAAWSQVNTPTSPSARHLHSMAYDSRRNVTVLFGGTNDPANNFNGETWEFDGANWHQVSTPNSPSGRYAHAMFYDEDSERVILFGGQTGPGASDLSGETWQFDGTDWVLQNLSVSPPPMQGMAATYDPSRRQGVIFGGITASGLQDRTWVYLGFNWYHLHTPVRPTARRSASLVHSTDRLVLVGGYTNTEVADPWIGKIEPNVHAYGAGCGSPALTVSVDPTTSPAVGSDLRLRVSNVPTGASMTLMSFGYDRTRYGSMPLPVPLDGLGMPGCWLLHNFGFEVGEPCVSTGVNSAEYYVPSLFPAQNELVGAHLYCQPWSIDLSSNTFGVITGNALDITIGAN